MLTKKIDRVGEPFTPSLLSSYMNWDKFLQAFAVWKPDMDSIQKYAHERMFSVKKRQLLVSVLKKQYEQIGGSNKKVIHNIDILTDVDTLTITTGQQIHAFLGPVFFVTKILDCIQTAKEATARSDGKTFVPVFWMASEDHDFDEVSSVRVYNDTFSWHKEESGGPVGRMSPVGLSPLADTIRERLDDKDLYDKYLDIFSYAYNHFDTLAQATHYILDVLFGDRGLIIIDADDPEFKKEFVSVLSDDIFSSQGTDAIVDQTDALVSVGFKKQAHPRSINVFFMTDNHRGRIVRDGDRYLVDGSDRVFSTSELQDTLDKSPESFSPNVFLRPLYQETILPNVAYISGPSELNYWLQMKLLFAVHDLTMPVVLPRTFNHFLGNKNYDKIMDGPVDLDTYFSSYEDFIKTIQSIDDSVLSDTQSIIDLLEDKISTLQKEFAEKRIKHKKITKSLSTIEQELTTLHRVVDSTDAAMIEESEDYLPYIKIHKKFFSPDDSFERTNSVVGQLDIIDALISAKDIDCSLGDVLLRVYD